MGQKWITESSLKIPRNHWDHYYLGLFYKISFLILSELKPIDKLLFPVEPTFFCDFRGNTSQQIRSNSPNIRSKIWSWFLSNSLHQSIPFSGSILSYTEHHASASSQFLNSLWITTLLKGEITSTCIDIIRKIYVFSCFFIF